MAWTKQQLIEMTRDAALRYGIDPSIAVEQIRQESSFNPRASSGVAYGLTQFTPATWLSYGEGGDIYDPSDSLEAWGRYMRHLIAVFNGDYRLALAAYHSGEKAAARALGNCPGNPRTCNYVETILSRAGVNRPASPATSGGDAGTRGGSADDRDDVAYDQPPSSFLESHKKEIIATALILTTVFVLAR